MVKINEPSQKKQNLSLAATQREKHCFQNVSILSLTYVFFPIYIAYGKLAN